jgi:hypothetical protein
MKLFSHAGVSTLNGITKVRFANNALRVKVLAKGGHRDIDLIELKHPMTKVDAVAYLLSIDFDNGNKTVRAAMELANDKRSGTPKAKVAPTKKKSVKADVAEAIKSAKAKLEPSDAVAVESEDMPY